MIELLRWCWSGKSQNLTAVLRKEMHESESHNPLIVRLARPEDMEAVYELTYVCYRQEGYCDMNEARRLVHYPHLDGIAETLVFVAEQAGAIVGTNSLTLDGPAGLHVDEDFPAEVASYRREAQLHDRRLAASWRIVTDPTCRALKVALELMNVTMMYGWAFRVHAMMFSFNPKHERFYRKLLGLSSVAYGACGSVNQAPGVLMHGWYRTMAEHWRKVVQRRDLQQMIPEAAYPSIAKDYR